MVSSTAVDSPLVPECPHSRCSSAVHNGGFPWLLGPPVQGITEPGPCRGCRESPLRAVGPAPGTGIGRASSCRSRSNPQPCCLVLPPVLASAPTVGCSRLSQQPAPGSWAGAGPLPPSCSPSPVLPSPASYSALHEVLLGEDTVSLCAVRGSASSPACPALLGTQTQAEQLIWLGWAQIRLCSPVLVLVGSVRILGRRAGCHFGCAGEMEPGETNCPGTGLGNALGSTRPFSKHPERGGLMLGVLPGVEVV